MYAVVTMQLTNYRDCDQGIEIIYLLLNDRDRGGMFICITIRARYVWWNHRNRSDVVTRLQRSYNYQDHHDIRDPSRHAMTFTRNWRCRGLEGFAASQDVHYYTVCLVYRATRLHTYM